MLIAPSEASLQLMLDVLNDWCRKWRLVINRDRTKVMHFRLNSMEKCRANFTCSDLHLDLTDHYKYTIRLKFSNFQLISKLQIGMKMN